MIKNNYLNNSWEEDFIERELAIELILQQGQKEFNYIKKNGFPQNKEEWFIMWDKVEKSKLNSKKIKEIFKRMDEKNKELLA